MTDTTALQGHLLLAGRLDQRFFALLQALGYAPGQTDAASLRALSLSYCLLPCALKLAAAALLYTFLIRPELTPCPTPSPHPSTVQCPPATHCADASAWCSRIRSPR